MQIQDFKVSPNSKLLLSEISAEGSKSVDLGKDEAKQALEELRSQLAKKQQRLYAQQKHQILIILQGVDASGKDSTIRSIFKGINPQGTKVYNFEKPTEPELSRDFLWRVHARVPKRGDIAIFNRSHYEDVLAVRVQGIVPEERWRKRYEHIRNFEEMLIDEGASLLKFYLHIDKDEQKKKLLKRIHRPEKRWKFTEEDVKARELWDEYREAYQEALAQTSTDKAPWYIVPANQKWARNFIIASIIDKKLSSLDISLPESQIDPDQYESQL